MWNRIKAAFLHSLTVLVSVLTCVIGILIANLESISSVVSTEEFKNNVAVLVGNDPAILGRWMMIVSFITLAARLRSIVPWESVVAWYKGDKKDDL